MLDEKRNGIFVTIEFGIAILNLLWVVIYTYIFDLIFSIFVLCIQLNVNFPCFYIRLLNWMLFKLLILSHFIYFMFVLHIFIRFLLFCVGKSSSALFDLYASSLFRLPGSCLQFFTHKVNLKTYEKKNLFHFPTFRGRFKEL